MAAQTSGVIARLILGKGFGFLRRDGDQDGPAAVFFHKTAVTGAAFEDLREGQVVTFDEVESPKGPRASRVEVEP